MDKNTSKSVKTGVVKNEMDNLMVVSQVTTSLLQNVHSDLKEVAKRFVRIGYSLYNFNVDRLYKELGYKTFDVFVKAEFGLAKSTAYSFINVALKYTVLSPEGTPTLTIKKEFQKFSSSQLVEMLGLDDETLKKVSPTNSIREIKKLKEQSVQTSGQNDSDDGKAKPKAKPVEKDSRVPVNRLFIGTAYSFAELGIHKPIIDIYCGDKKKADGKSYRIEINVIWDDLTDNQNEDNSSMNVPVSPDDSDDSEE